MATKKNTAAEVRAEGFSYQQFGYPDDAGFDTDIDKLLNEQALIVEARVGATAWAAASDVTAAHVKRAERFLACAELWSRRINRLESETVIGGESDKSRGITEFRKNQQNYLAMSDKEYASVDATPAAAAPSSGVAFSAETSSHFPAAAT